MLVCAADVLRVMPSKAIELMAFDVFKNVFSRPGERPGPFGTMFSGALAGLCRWLPLLRCTADLAVDLAACCYSNQQLCFVSVLMLVV